MTDIEKLIEVAKQVLSMHDPEPVEKIDSVGQIVSYQMKLIDRGRARLVLELCDHYEEKLKGMATINQVIENSRCASNAVIAEIREWADDNDWTLDADYGFVGETSQHIEKNALMKKLHELEARNG